MKHFIRKHSNKFGKKFFTLTLGLVLVLGLFTGCRQAAGEGVEPGGATESMTEAAGENSAEETAVPATEESASSESGIEAREAVDVRVGSLKGPTSMGILFLQQAAEDGEMLDNYSFQMATGADELVPLVVKGELDIALVPSNVAANLYQKTEGGIAVIDINTLGVLYLVSGTTEVSQVADLEGKTIYLTGKGTTPEAAIRYLLKAYGIEDTVTLEFQSEATEVAAVLAENPDAIGLLPQPFVTSALMQNDALHVVMDLNEEWKNIRQGENANTGIVTGVTIVRKEFLEAHPEAVADFLAAHKESAQAINDDAETGAALAVAAGIVGKEAIAQKAIPECNITCITGDEMKNALSAYLNTLYDFNAELVGGSLPENDFYAINAE